MDKENYNFITYYYLNDKYHCYSHLTKKITVKTKLPMKINNFEMLGKGYKATDEDLIRYTEDLIKANDEFVEYLTSKNIRYNYLKKYVKDGKEKYINHYKNCITFFNCFSNKEIRQKIKDSEAIDKIEEDYHRKCYNTGIIYEDYKSDIPIQCYGYDKKNFYASLLGQKSYKYEIPINKGYETKITKLNKDNIKYGIYKCKISCSDPEVRKVFSFSKLHYYTHYSILQAYKLQEYFKDMTIELITDTEYNAYVYDELVDSYKLFEGWYNLITEMKEKYPKNLIVKLLSSSLWGQLTKYKQVVYNKTTIDEKDLNVGRIYEKCDYLIVDYFEGKHTLINLNDPYVNKFRLKPFLTSLGRNIISNIALRFNYKDILRVYCDAIIFNKQLVMKTTKPTFIPDEKHTGMYKFPFRNN